VTVIPVASTVGSGRVGALGPSHCSSEWRACGILKPPLAEVAVVASRGRHVIGLRSARVAAGAVIAVVNSSRFSLSHSHSLSLSVSVCGLLCNRRFISGGSRRVAEEGRSAGLSLPRP